jgi:hypothetical protein
MARAIVVNIKQSNFGGATTAVGQINDKANNKTIGFEVYCPDELGLAEGLKVVYDSVIVGGVEIANAVELLEKGVIQTIDMDPNTGAMGDTGTLLDKSSGNIINFEQRYLAQMGIKVGTVVSFQGITPANQGTVSGTTGGTAAAGNPTGSRTGSATVVATALRLIK